MQQLNTKIGVSAIAWLNDDTPELTNHVTLEQALADMEKIGFKGTENGTAFPKDAAALSSVLCRYNLELVSGWYTGKLAERSYQDELQAIKAQLKLFKELGAAVIVYGETSRAMNLRQPLLQKPTIAKDEFPAYARKVDDLAKYCNDFGVPLALHQHMGTCIQHMDELHRLMDLTTELHITFDTGHCLLAGGDPLEICQMYAQRINHLHLKDVRKPMLDALDVAQDSFTDVLSKGVFTVPGDGCIDYDPIIDTLRQHGYQGWFVIEAEQDPRKADPYAFSKQGYEYTQQLALRHNYQLN